VSAPPLVIQEQLPPGETLAERLLAARAAGFDGLELLDADPGRVSGVQALQRDGARFPTACPALGGWLGDFDPAKRRQAIEGLRRQLDGVAALGGLGVVTPAAWGMFTRRLPPFEDPPRTPEQDREILLEGLAEVGGHAAAAGVVLLFEPLNRYEDHMVNSVAQAAELIAAVGSPGVRMLADTYHMNIEEDDVCAALRAAAGVLGAVHLSDSNRHQPGAGHVPFEALIATLADVGFEGVLSVECRLRGHAGEAVAASGRLLRDLLDAWPHVTEAAEAGPPG
jgi:sugar phosphate isomerase/epimerase